MASSNPVTDFQQKWRQPAVAAKACFLPHVSPQQRLNFPEQPFVFSVRRFCFAPRVLRQAGRCRIGFDTPCRSVLAPVRCNGYARGAELVIPEIANSEDVLIRFFWRNLLLHCSRKRVKPVRICSEFARTVSAFFTQSPSISLGKGSNSFTFKHLTKRHQACYTGV